MKKFLVAVMLVVVAGTGCLILSACNNHNPDQITRFGETLEEAESFEVICTMETPISGFRYTIKVDGDKTYESAFMDSPAVYTEKIGSTIYTYTLRGDTWVKTSAPVFATDEEEGAEEYLPIFDGSNFVYSKEAEAFVLKEDAAILWSGMEFVTLEIALGKNSCDLSGKVMSEGMLLDVELEFKNLNTTEIVLPEAVEWY